MVSLLVKVSADIVSGEDRPTTLTDPRDGWATMFDCLDHPARIFERPLTVSDCQTAHPNLPLTKDESHRKAVRLTPEFVSGPRSQTEIGQAEQKNASSIQTPVSGRPFYRILFCIQCNLTGIVCALVRFLRRLHRIKQLRLTLDTFIRKLFTTNCYGSDYVPAA